MIPVYGQLEILRPETFSQISDGKILSVFWNTTSQPVFKFDMYDAPIIFTISCMHRLSLPGVDIKTTPYIAIQCVIPSQDCCQSLSLGPATHNFKSYGLK